MFFSKKNKKNKSVEEIAKNLQNKTNQVFKTENSKLKKSISTKHDEALYNEFTYNCGFFKSWINVSTYSYFLNKVPAQLKHQSEQFLVIIIMTSHLFNESDCSNISNVLLETLKDIDKSQNYSDVPSALASYFNFIANNSALDFSTAFISECIQQISIVLTN